MSCTRALRSPWVFALKPARATSCSSVLTAHALSLADSQEQITCLGAKAKSDPMPLALKTSKIHSTKKNPFVSTKKYKSIWVIWGNACISDAGCYFDLGTLVNVQLQFLREVHGHALRGNPGNIPFICHKKLKKKEWLVVPSSTFPSPRTAALCS